MARSILLCSAAVALAVPSAALAQSTGTIDFERDSIVVTGVRAKDVGGVEAPRSSKAKAVLGQEMIARMAPGQSINDTLNLVPGVSFQNNDPFGSAGGRMTIRGFDSTRISQTVDGIPLNDSGNYALYTNQQIDPELIDQVNVNLGSTDVDSPTASATGSTVNLRTLTPSEDFSVLASGAAGDFDYFRVFGLIQTGSLNGSGTRAWIAASTASNDNIYGVGRIDKQQYNAKIYQPIGSNGDFISIAGHFNRNRNNFFGSVPLRLDAGRVVGSGSGNRFPTTKDERFYGTASCMIDTPEPGAADKPNGCGTAFDYRYNPSDTGNVRMSSRFTLADSLVLTVDPSYQSVKANGGGTVTGYEYAYSGSNTSGRPAYGFIGGAPYFGLDLNGDGDLLDQVTLGAPSQTRTHRIGVIASLVWDFAASQTARLNYTYDRARHRQTGEVGQMLANGYVADYFPSDRPMADVTGAVLQKRDRLSWAILHQISGEYAGRFLDDRLGVNLGLRAPFFRRNLTNNCYTTSATGFVNCTVTGVGGSAYSTFAPAAYAPPQQRVLDYNRVLPNAGITYDFTPAFGIYFNYSRGIQVPGTDNLYNSFYFAPGTPEASPKPETTDNFDLGARYRSATIQAQLTGWFTNYKDRLASAYDPVLDTTVYRNLGTVHKYGVDGSVAWAPVPAALLYVWGSYLKSEIRDNVQIGTDAADNPIYAMTKGKRESAAPTFTIGARAQVAIGPLDLGGQVKRTGPRYVNDQNTPVYQTIGGKLTEVYGAKAPAYTLVDLDARLNLGGFTPLGDKTWVQINVLNVFDKLYVGSFDGNLLNTSVPFAQIGYPRTFMASLVVGF